MRRERRLKADHDPGPALGDGANETSVAPLILWFEDLSMDDLATVGGKNASLGVLSRDLARDGVPVPVGFAVTTEAFRLFLEANTLEMAIRDQMGRMHDGRISLAKAGAAIRHSIDHGQMPEGVRTAIVAAYRQLSARLGTRTAAVAVRSSATAEDLPGASFAGQLESFLNIRGIDALIATCRRCFASLFTDRAIAYREAKGFDHLTMAVSVGVQQMVRSDRAGAGVLFTLDPDTGFPDLIVINAAWGLGETVVQGQVEPDRYLLFKPLLDASAVKPIVGRDCGSKSVKLVYGRTAAQPTKLRHTARSQRDRLVLEDDEILQLGRWAQAIERHYAMPMDIEWAKDGITGQLFIVQARAETVHAASNRSRFLRYHLKSKEEPIVSGAAIGTAVVTGKASVIGTPADLAGFPAGAILVAENTDPDWVPIMKRAAGIVTDHGGPTSHAAIVSRELGVPAIVGTARATSSITDGQAITLSCAEGERGHVYSGELPFTREEVDLGTLPETDAEVMVNIADPAAALAWWKLPARGVGLARLEFVIANIIHAHPMALLHPDRTPIPVQRTLRKLTRRYANAADYFVDTLACGIARLALPWYPHPAIIRFSDFKTNEYARLAGGASFEPCEENPMIGFRGASRYYDTRYREGFALECQAVKKVRDDMGFANVIVMIPFCRTPEEADRVLEEMAGNGLRRGENGLQIYMMCEIPANIVRADEFARRFDGFSIGSNDLTQLMLGIDRDSEILQPLFDERDPAVMISIAKVIERAHAAGIKIGICGEAPSNHADFAAFLVHAGIDSLSLNPDSFLRTLRTVADAEHGWDKHRSAASEGGKSAAMTGLDAA